ncbi:MAG: FAD:protein FMN transferase [Streptococcaceae bacterium]|jgi:thiamine biosynthesis lipoprotein|nr:FAD:protein FMN transferase [Streptococcaceae bacterium]
MISNLAQQALTQQYFALGTGIELTIYGAEIDDGKKLLTESCQLIDAYETRLTVNRAVSEMMSVNQAAGQEAVQVSSSTYQLVRRAIEISQEHFGFNAAIGPLVKLWHIGFKDAKVPEIVEIAAAKQLVSPDAIQFNDANQSIFLPEVGMEIDLGGIGKGYIADRVQDLWRSRGLSAGIINLGGNLILMGNPPQHEDGLWRIGIRNPLNKTDDSVAIVAMPACSAVTSGIAERFLEVDGETYHHIISPETGYPHNNDIASITIFSRDSIDGEIETTRLFFANGPVPNWLANPNFYGAVFAYRDKTLEFVGIPEGHYRIMNPEYRVR